MSWHTSESERGAMRMPARKQRISATVLVVDDREPSRRFLRRRLSARGYQVVEAADGAEGLKRFRSHHPDLVITDMRMPQTDGMEFLRQLRKLARVPVYCITAHPEWQASAEAIKRGADEYFMWPRDVERLLDCVDSAMRSDDRRSLEDTRACYQARQDAKRRAELEHWLELTGANVTRTAEALSVDRKTIYSWCRRYGIPLRADEHR
jgi:DNA-binding NtrC family response regulator